MLSTLSFQWCVHVYYRNIWCHRYLNLIWGILIRCLVLKGSELVQEKKTRSSEKQKLGHGNHWCLILLFHLNTRWSTLTNHPTCLMSVIPPSLFSAASCPILFCFSCLDSSFRLCWTPCISCISRLFGLKDEFCIFTGSGSSCVNGPAVPWGALIRFPSRPPPWNRCSIDSIFPSEAAVWSLRPSQMLHQDRGVTQPEPRPPEACPAHTQTFTLHRQPQRGISIVCSQSG